MTDEIRKILGLLVIAAGLHLAANPFPLARTGMEWLDFIEMALGLALASAGYFYSFLRKV